MTFAPRPTARFVIAAPEPSSSEQIRMTLAPCARHCSACDFIFCGSLWAFRTCAEMPADLNAFLRYGASNRVHRVDVTVSGSRAQAWMVAALLLNPSLWAEAPVAAWAAITATASSG